MDWRWPALPPMSRVAYLMFPSVGRGSHDPALSATEGLLHTGQRAVHTGVPLSWARPNPPEFEHVAPRTSLERGSIQSKIENPKWP
jgi:hypothetical protein